MFKKLPIIIAISVSASVSADMKILISAIYRYRPIRKRELWAYIGIGRYEKKLIGLPLHRVITNYLTYGTIGDHILNQNKVRPKP